MLHKYIWSMCFDFLASFLFSVYPFPEISIKYVYSVWKSNPRYMYNDLGIGLVMLLIRGNITSLQTNLYAESEKL